MFLTIDSAARILKGLIVETVVIRVKGVHECQLDTKWNIMAADHYDQKILS
jgi:hypothetical protein